jgi:uncharacterized LabA/DUF88 family protein
MTTTTFLQIDLQTLFFEAKNRVQKIDFEKIWESFNSRETEFLTKAVIYTVEGEAFYNAKFNAKLISTGYDVKLKSPLYRGDTNHCINITLDCIEKIDIFDKWILMTSDGNFSDLCKYLKNKNKKTEIWCFKKCFNSSMEMYTDKVYFLDNNEFFYKKPQIDVFGFNWGP